METLAWALWEKAASCQRDADHGNDAAFIDERAAMAVAYRDAAAMARAEVKRERGDVT